MVTSLMFMRSTHSFMVFTGQGEPVFLAQGGNSPYLEHIITVLRGINDGVQAGKAMFAAFQALELIQPMTLDVRFDDNHGVNLTGLYGIDRERLAGLDAASLHELHRVQGRYALVTMCIGGGQGIAVVFERL